MQRSTRPKRGEKGPGPLCGTRTLLIALIHHGLNGGTGSDLLNGGEGNDDLFGNSGDDDMFGEGGDDYINAADKRPGETVVCGPGAEDEAVVDGVEGGVFTPVAEPTDDVGPDCERVFIAASGINFGGPGPGTLSQDQVPQAVAEGTLEEAE